uniref:acetyl-CoA C-acyltransferase n=1 Tax=Nephromyces sp. MMRI TaxID=2496275 RepID=A0A3Q8UBV5_9APIC|nr:acetyl-CoA acyltransferase 1 [Nephromyces sp. MMRI]AZL94415.1 acetyl-CoA acyltransferase 1 [Nephromyces sp. MMRI]AZL94416.1 acetyl-CoA acyltransferase 1 [Nephromyces sp. MMRI]
MHRLQNLSDLTPSVPTNNSNKKNYHWKNTIKNAGPSPQSPDDIVICGAVRTALTKAKRGGFKDTKTEELLAPLFTALIEETGLKKDAIQDICIGNVLQRSVALCSRVSQYFAGVPSSVPVHTINRQCSSGLQAIAAVAASIKANYIDIGLAGGVESMTNYEMSDALSPSDISTSAYDVELARNCLIPMGVVSELFTEKMKYSRNNLDIIGVHSQKKAAKANEMGLFKEEIVPVTTMFKDSNGNTKEILVQEDDGIRPNTNLKNLEKLKSPFKKGGSSHSGNSSQKSDGAALCIVARRSKAEELGLPIIAKFHAFSLVGVAPEQYPEGPALAIPKVLKETGLTMGDIDIFEVNEAFASVVHHTIEELKIPQHKLNPKGGAIAIGHPLGCTGARQLATLLPELRRTKSRYGIVSMCIGTGMGAAAVFENLIL